jgi:uncharacterized protein YjbI with pentapeptide repeats
MVVITLLLAGSAKTVSDNAALIGALVGLGGVFTTQLVNSALEDRRARQARDTEQAQRQRELEVGDQRAQDEALQTYVNEIGQQLLDEKRPLRQSRIDSEERTLTRARTLTVLTRLDATRKRSVLQYLYESALINKGHVVVYLEGADLKSADLSAFTLSRGRLSSTNLSSVNAIAASLSEADLRNAYLGDADLSAANLYAADLSGAYLSKANLHAANLLRADLSDASLSDADLSTANLHGAGLTRADLRGADLRGANLSDAHLSDADLRGGDLRVAVLSGSSLSGTDLRGADLGGAVLRNTDLSNADLTNATMPNGQTYEEWLETPESRPWLKTYEEGCKKDEENSGPSERF